MCQGGSVIEGIKQMMIEGSGKLYSLKVHPVA
jgi:hypothetical protein